VRPDATGRNRPEGRGSIRRESLLAPLALAQALLGARVLWRFAATAHGVRIPTCDTAPPPGARVAVIVPVLNERERLAPCLDGLIAQGPEVTEILVVDGGSVDGTRDLVARYSARDVRVRLIDAGPAPGSWNGKAWNLQVGAERVGADVAWILTVDADVRPAPLLVRSLLAHARRTGLAAFSVATRQEVSGLGEALLHPVLLTTLVYRFGLPGGATSSVRGVQANGQCFLVRRAVLRGSQALSAARASRCEDVTIARRLAALGWAVGFYEADDLVWVKMYANGRDVWRNWPRSLPLRDQYAGVAGALGLAEVVLVQALPLPLLVLLRLIRARRWMRTLNLVLVLARLGVLLGTARAYRRVLWSYWLSPLCDGPAAVALCRSALRRRHTWRGRVLVLGGT
jgi:dolichol-phosphate mannosyltransferase